METPDGGTSDAATSPGPDLPNGAQPVFVGMGYGTRRVVSWDFGQTWEIDATSDPNGADDATLVRGLTYADGAFVVARGSTSSRRIFRITQATAADLCPMVVERGGHGFSDVAYGNGIFVAAGGHVASVSSDGGWTWSDEEYMGTGSQKLKRVAFGDVQGGRFVAVGEGGRRVRSADGIQWDDDVTGGPVLEWVDFGAGTFVAVTQQSNATRYSTDGGQSWNNGEISGAENVRGILHDGSRFIVTTGGDTFTSVNGIDWQRHDAGGGPDSFDVSDDGKHYAGAYGGTLFHATDGIHFDAVKDDNPQYIVEVVFGYLERVDACPEGTAWD